VSNVEVLQSQVRVLFWRWRDHRCSNRRSGRNKWVAQAEPLTVVGGFMVQLLATRREKIAMVQVCKITRILVQMTTVKLSQLMTCSRQGQMRIGDRVRIMNGQLFQIMCNALFQRC
jgi:hypothetical protein